MPSLITAAASRSPLIIHAEQTPVATGRRIEGLVLPWGKVGRTSSGPLTVAQGTVTLPEDLSRVKLLRNHSTEPGYCPVGHAVSAEQTAEGLKMSFSIGQTPDGDLALADVTEGIRDALSVELIDTAVSGDQLTAGTLSAVALVAIPAFEDARVESVTASRAADDENTTAGEEQTPPPPARAPRSVITGRGHAPLTTFAQVVEAICAARSGVAGAEITAALADITRSAHPSISAPAWLGELWSGVGYTREIIPTMTQKNLTAMKAVGWRWKQRPSVEDYAGDKAEIPTGPVSTEAVEVAAKRLAVGHDIDRAYFDFNEKEFLSSYFAACAEDYALKSDTRAAEFIIAAAGTGTKITAEPDLLHAAARARQTLRKQTRSEASAYLVNPDDLFGLFQITQLDNPAYLDLLGVDPSKFISSDLVPAGKVIAYCKPAVTWYELAGSPIRVTVEDLGRGGRDSAIFGYYATLLNNQAGIVEVPIGAPAGAGAELGA